MTFVLIRGTYFPAIGEPDGDSVRFAAADISLWDRLDGRVDDPGTNDTLQLRFEGIDALEKTAIHSEAVRKLPSPFIQLSSRFLTIAKNRLRAW